MKNATATQSRIANAIFGDATTNAALFAFPGDPGNMNDLLDDDEIADFTDALGLPPVAPPPAPPEPTPPAPPAPSPTPETAAAPAYWRVASHFKPRPAFETVLYAALNDILTADEIATKLLASGEYQRVAPKAAANRPLKPINFLLREWVARGILARTR